MKEIAVIGIQGVPARYGGFETLVENLLNTDSSKDIHYTVFCSSRAYSTRLNEYKHACLKYIPLKANGVQSILYDIMSMLRCGNRYDVILILGVSGCIFLPVYRLFYKNRIIVNIDGLEHRRAKWGWLARRFLLTSEKMAVKYADVIVSDNKGINDYVKETYHVESELIAYGGDQALADLPAEKQNGILKSLGLETESYCLTICRIEPENNCDAILEAFSQSSCFLAMVGNFEHSSYSRQLKDRFCSCPNISLFDAIYDNDVLFTLRNNCRYYVHGHSAGGTNPSLVEAMFFGRTILAYDVGYNRFTTGGMAYYWKNATELSELVSSCPGDCGLKMLEHAKLHYTWKQVSGQYKKLLTIMP